MTTRKTLEAGFAMVDTLVALTLLSVVGTVLISAQSLSYKSAAKAKQKATALAVAKSQLRISDTSEAGEVIVDGQRYRWVVELELVNPSPSKRSVQLLEKSIVVEWGGEKNGIQALMLKTKTIR